MPSIHRTIEGWHLVQPGQQLTYHGLDQTLWGLLVTVTGLCPVDYHCRVTFAEGWSLTQVDEHGLVAAAPATAVPGGVLR